MTLRVVLLGKFPPTCGQVSSLDLWLAAGLVRRGVQLAVCSDAMFPAKRRVRAAPGADAASALDELLPGVEIVYAEHLAAKAFLPFSELAYVSYLAAARETVLRHRPDVILSHYLEPYALAGDLIASELGIPHVVTHAGSDIVRLAAPEPIRSLYRAVLGRAAFFVAKSKIARETFGDVARLFESAPYVPDPGYFHPAPDAGAARERLREDPVFGFYGKFVHGKNLDKLIDAFRIYRRRHGKGRLVLMGGDIGGGFSMQKLLETEPDAAVELRDFVPPWRIPHFLNSLSCLVYTKAGYRVQQHAAIVMREAVACATPVIATQESLAGSPSDLLEHARMRLVDPDGTAEDLSEVMAEMIANPPDGKGWPRELLERGYAAHVDSWHRCLTEAAGAAR